MFAAWSRLVSKFDCLELASYCVVPLDIVTCNLTVAYGAVSRLYNNNITPDCCRFRKELNIASNIKETYLSKTTDAISCVDKIQVSTKVEVKSTLT